jgi:hypothetical protein
MSESLLRRISDDIEAIDRRLESAAGDAPDDPHHRLMRMYRLIDEARGLIDEMRVYVNEALPLGT